MRSKTIALFLALGMTASVVACGESEAPEGGEGTEAPSEQIIPEATPETEGTEGGEGGEG